MKIGWRYILPVWGVTLLVLIFSDAVVLNLLLVVLSFLVAYLFYVPERVKEEASDNAVFSPVDGRVLSIEDREGNVAVLLKKSVFGGSSAVRAPVRGDIVKKRVIHGLFLDSKRGLAAHLNENATIVWKIDNRKIVMNMRCGFYAFGLPLFVSQRESEAAQTVALLTDGIVELLMPKNTKVEVAPGDRVVGGHSLLAHGIG